MTHIGTLWSFVREFCTGIIQLAGQHPASSGKQQDAAYFLILAAVLNIVLDLVFIIVFHMGAAAAYATVISQISGGCVWFISFGECRF
ncbi:MAG: polysaccharide biosynthesis C-terminal domain-containing protein [Ruminococcus sp.]